MVINLKKKGVKMKVILTDKYKTSVTDKKTKEKIKEFERLSKCGMVNRAIQYAIDNNLPYHCEDEETGVLI